MDFVSTNLGGAIVDNFTMTKTSTCNFGMHCEPEATVANKSVDRRSVEKGAIASHCSAIGVVQFVTF